jgi:poly-beta-1,6-N-acetyl-D-glucosamine synthase
MKINQIKLGVILPAYNEELVIEKTIQSILDAGMSSHDIFVINDASKDRTAEFAGAMGVNVINNEVNLGKAGGVTRALNQILSSDHGYTHICFMDADTLVDSEYFNAIVRTLHNDLVSCEASGKKTIGVLCGKVKSIPHNWLTAFRAYELWLSYAIHKVAQSRITSITISPGCTSTYNIEILKYVIWSEDTVVEDMDATVQVALKKDIIKYESAAIVYTQDPNNIKDYLGQVGNRWYPGSWQVMGKYKLLQNGIFSMFHWECRMMMIEPLVYSILILYFLIFNTIHLLNIFLIASISIIFFSIIASIQERRFDIFLYSPIFPFLAFLNLFILVSKIDNIFGRRKSALKWYSPTRYKITGERK